MVTLYEDLQATAEINETLNHTFQSLRKNVERIGRRHPLIAEIVIPETPEIDVSEAERDCIEQNRGNFCLDIAISSDMSLERRLEELDKKFRGFRRFIPHRKGPISATFHNREVEKMGELIDADHLRKRGLFAPDNFLSASGYATATVFGISNLIQLSNQNPEQIELASRDLIYIPLILSIFLAPFVGGICQIERGDRKYRAGIKEQAKYIDNKIAELF